MSFDRFCRQIILSVRIYRYYARFLTNNGTLRVKCTELRAFSPIVPEVQVIPLSGHLNICEYLSEQKHHFSAPGISPHCLKTTNLRLLNKTKCPKQRKNLDRFRTNLRQYYNDTRVGARVTNHGKILIYSKNKLFFYNIWTLVYLSWFRKSDDLGNYRMPTAGKNSTFDSSGGTYLLVNYLADVVWKKLLRFVSGFRLIVWNLHFDFYNNNSNIRLEKWNSFSSLLSASFLNPRKSSQN